MRGHRLVRVLDQIDQRVLDLRRIGHDGSHGLELGDHRHPVAAEVVGLQLQRRADLILEATRLALHRVGPRELQEVLQHLSRARRLLDDHVDAFPALGRVVRRQQQQLGLAQRGRQEISKLVDEARRELAHRGELLALDELDLRRPQVFELSPGGRIELRVFEGEADLVGHGLDQLDLRLREWLRGPATQRQGAEDPSTAPDRHACEPVDPFLPDHGAGGRQQVGRLARVSQRDRATAHHDPADHAFADREDAVDLAQKRPQSAVAP